MDTGQAGFGDGPIAAEPLPGAERQGSRRGRADRTAGARVAAGEERCRGVQQLDLEPIVIGDDAAEKPARGARPVGQPVAEQSTR